jgi:uncharacterized protein YgbK (DUF1537 family)
MMTPTQSKAELLARLPPEPDEKALLPEIRRLAIASGRQLVVIDDDPTGVQTVHDVPIYLHWDHGVLEEALGDRGRPFFLLTNSRSMPGDQAARVNRDTARLLVEAARARGVQFVIASRSDSTLRGHYPAEVTALQEGLGRRCDGHLLIPAFFEGGRFTIGDTHYVAAPDAASDALLPASDTPYAQDRVFGYTTAFLPAWIEEKSSGAFHRAQVGSLSLDLIRRGGPQAVADRLQACRGGMPVVVNAAGYGDLAVVALGALMAEAAGKMLLYRTAASFVRVRGAMDHRPLLTAGEVLGRFAQAAGGGLVVVGSHVPGSSAQLEKLLQVPGTQGVELAAEHAIVGAEEAAAAGYAAGRRLEDVIRAGRVGVLHTSRKLVLGGSDAENLLIGHRVAHALAAAVQAVVTRPRFLVAKGGITSQVTAQHGLGAHKARAIGQILPGVPVWKLESGAGLKFPGVPYVVFPGNVGDPGSLAQVVTWLM